MRYVYEVVEDCIERLNWDDVRRIFPTPDTDTCSFWQEQYPTGWHIRFNHLTVSIQCRRDNYCDYYMPGRLSQFYYEHPYTTTAEVAIIASDGRWVRVDDEHMNTIWGYADLDTIRLILTTIAAYTGQVIQGDVLEASA